MKQITCRTILLLLTATAFSGCRTAAPVSHQQRPDSSTFERRIYKQPDREDFAKALAFFGAGVIDQVNMRFDASLTNFLAAIELDPYNEELHLRTAVVYLQMKQPEKAVAIIETLCKKKPDSAQAYVWQGIMSRSSGNQRKAYISYRKALQLDPKNSDSYKELASTYLIDSEPEKAILILERGAQRVDDPTEILYFLGELYNHKAELSKNSETAIEYRESARKTLERAQSINPDNSEVLYLLSNLYIADDQFENAATSLHHLSELEPDNLPIKKKLALAYAATGREEEAALILEDITRKVAVNPRAYYYLGELYEKMGQKAKAILNFRLATQIDPPDPSPYLHLALLTMDDSSEEAITYLRDGLLRLPDDPRLTETLAYLYMNETNYPYAVRYFKKAVDVLSATDTNAVSSTLAFNYALAAQYSGDVEKSADLLMQALQNDPDALNAYIQFLFREGDTKRITSGRKVFLHLLKRNPPQRKAVLTHLALLYSYDQMYDKAVKLYAKVLEAAQATETTDSLTDQFYFWYGSSLERLGRMEEAAEQFKKCISLNPKHAAAYNYLAYMWAEKGLHLGEAEKYINKALELEPDNPAFLDTLGWILYMKGSYALAEEEIRKALNLLPEDSTINEHYGNVLNKLENSSIAKPYWLKALELDPANKQLEQQLIDMNILPEQSTTE